MEVKKVFKIESKTLGITREYNINYEGIENFINNTYENSESSSLKRWASSFMDKIKCEKCKGSRLNKESLQFKIYKKKYISIIENGPWRTIYMVKNYF